MDVPKSSEILHRQVDVAAVWNEVLVPAMRDSVKKLAEEKLDTAVPVLFIHQGMTREAMVNTLVDIARVRALAVFRTPKTNGEFPSS